MPHQALKISGGVITNASPALNQAGIAASNLIRFKPNPLGGMSLIEKIGGWVKFYANQVIPAPIRAMWAYQDSDVSKWLIYGTSSETSSTLVALECTTDPTTGVTTAGIGGNYVNDITPLYQSDSFPAIFSTTAGSSLVTVTDTTISGVSQYDTVYITTPVSVGGLVLSGMYPTTVLSGSQYQIQAVNLFGTPTPAKYTNLTIPLSVTAGSTVAGTPTTITLTFTGTYTFLAGEAVTVNRISPSVWNGTFIVQSCVPNTSVTFIYNAASVVLPGYVSGGSLSNFGMTPQFVTTNGTPVITCILPNHGYVPGQEFYILNDTLVNGVSLYGDFNVLTVPNAYSFTFNGSGAATSSGYQFQGPDIISAGSGDGTNVTLTLEISSYSSPFITVGSGTWAANVVTIYYIGVYEFTIGSTIVVTGMTPSALNGAFTVVSVGYSAPNYYVTYALTGSGTVSGTGTIQNAPYNVGSTVIVSGVSQPSGWNGVYVVTNVSANTITYANTTTGDYFGGGSVNTNGGAVDYIYSIAVGAPPSATGYGVGGYGAGGYGTGQVTLSAGGTDINTINWDIGNWGDIAMALPTSFAAITYPDGETVQFQPIYYWHPNYGQITAQAISSGPQASNGMFVAMPQRQIIAWGTTFSGIIDPLLIRWCDVNNYNSWIGQVTNQAGYFRLTTGSEIVGALQVSQQALIWTDVDVWTMNYTGQPYVYNISKLSDECGLRARRARGVLNDAVYWMGNDQFYVYRGSGVAPLICPVWDNIFQQLDTANQWKIVCAPNSLFQEITWYYPVQNMNNGENSAYVKYNAVTQEWDYGFLARTAWIDASVMGPPLGFDPGAGYIYQHEMSSDADGTAITPSFTTGLFALAEGDMKMFVDQIWPDMVWEKAGYNTSATVQMTFTLYGYPGDTGYTYGPYSLTSATRYISPRMRGRLMSITVSSDDLGTWWRLGAIRYRIAPDGKY
jgi:hypothetical protein